MAGQKAHKDPLRATFHVKARANCRRWAMKSMSPFLKRIEAYQFEVRLVQICSLGIGLDSILGAVRVGLAEAGDKQRLGALNRSVGHARR
jgi:hypothetical protein